MPNFVRLTVPIDKDTAAAARRLRALLVGTPAGADLCAGVETMSVDTIDRLYVATFGLQSHLQHLVEIARGERFIIADGPPTLYIFDLLDTAGAVIDAVTVKWNANDEPGARTAAAAKLSGQTFRLSHEPGRIVTTSDAVPRA